MSEISRTAAVSEVGEHVLIGELQRRIGEAPGVIVGIGDDAAVVGLSEPTVAVSTDVLVQDRHFRLNWSSANDIGHRVAGANLADIAAMGAMPTSLVVGLVLPPTTQVGWVLDFLDGLAQECESIGAAVVGGDLAAGDTIMISATALGDLQGREPVRRNGAQPADVVAIAGRLGWAGAGLSLLSRGFTSPRVLVEAHRVPKPPYLAGIHAASAGAHAMLDVSDGLLTDLGHIAAASGVSIDIEAAAVPIDDPVRDAASAFNADALAWVLAGGDDHAIAATFAPDTQLPPGFTVIGRVHEPDGDGPTVTVDSVARPDLRGFDHFR
ncbi:MAG: thiamine-phosphate kinase [Candidatus Nanopelagicales bacterium]